MNGTGADQAPAGATSVSSRIEAAVACAVRAAKSTAVEHWDLTGLFAVFVVAVVVRLYRIDTVPSSLTADEADFYQNVFGVLDHGRPHFLGFDWTGAPALGLYMMSWSVRVFGVSVYGLRMSAIVLSLATLVPVYLLARRALSPLVATLTVLMLATTPWYLHFSRTAWTNMNAALFAAGAAAGMMLGLDLRGARSWLSFAAAGVFAALGLYGYQSGHIIPLLLACYLPFAVVIYWPERRRVLLGFAIAATAGLIVAAPLIPEIRNHWDSYKGRSEVTSIIHGRSRDEVLDLIPDQVRHNFHGFVLLDNSGNIFRHGTEAPRYAPRDASLFDPISRVLFFVGLAAGAVRWRKTVLWWGMYLGPVVSIQVFTVSTPDGARGLLVVPFIALFIGLGLDTLMSFVRWAAKRWRPRYERSIAAVASAVAVAVAIAVAVVGVRLYFDWMEQPYALADRQPAVYVSEFAEWSRLERASLAGGFNVGAWRIRQDRAGCLRGTALPGLCEDIGISDVSSPLKDVMPMRPEIPPSFVRASSVPITSAQFRQMNNDADKLLATLSNVDIEDGWATLYRDGMTATFSSTVVRFDGDATAQGIFLTRVGLTGGDFLGGPQMEVLGNPAIGEHALLTRTSLAGLTTLELFWQRGNSIAQLQMRSAAGAAPAIDAQVLVALGQAEDARLATAPERR
jgi:4-amino-4-deoxy-L-arabinose transferase-like glycosyltransferase